MLSSPQEWTSGSGAEDGAELAKLMKDVISLLKILLFYFSKVFILFYWLFIIIIIC